MAESSPLYFDRLRKVLLEHTHLELGEHKRKELEDAFGKLEKRAFNEAFLMRNCFVHNGGRVSSQLARYTARNRGEQIVLEKGEVGRLLDPIRETADEMTHLWLVL